MTGTAVGPDLKNPIPVEIEQTAPGRYVGSFAVRDAGSYFVTINPGQGMAPLRTGVTVPYSAEFRDRGSNEALLKQLAAVEPKDGPPGRVIENKDSPESPLTTESIAKLHGVNTFRHDLPKATSSQETWYWLLVLASCVFLGDVFIRRVSVSFEWLRPVWTRTLDFVLRRQPAATQPQFIERLKSRKAEVTGQLEQIRAATRFEMPDPQAGAPLPDLEKAIDELAPPPAAAPPAGDKPSLSVDKEQESYTERLLKAKKKAQEEREP